MVSDTEEPMMADSVDPSTDDDPSFVTRLFRVVVSVVILTLLTVILGYGGWLVLSVYVWLGGAEPMTDDGDRLRPRLVEWPDRNRDVMRSDGRRPLPWTP